MNCPRCGNVIYQGDISCRACGCPVAMMSGQPGETSPVIPEKKESPKPVISNQSIESFYTDMASMHQQVVPPKKEAKIPKKEVSYHYGEAEKAFKSPKFIIPIIIGLFVLLGISYGIFQLVTSIYQNQKEKEEQFSISSYKIEFQNFLYEIPGDMTYQKSSANKTLYLRDANDTYEVSIQVMNSTYSSVRSRKASLKSYFQSLGYTVSDVQEESYGSSTYLLMEASKKNKNYLLGIAKAGDSSKCFGISILTTENTIGYEYLEKLGRILTEATYQANNTSVESTIDFDFSNALK